MPPRYANGHISSTGDPIHFMFGSTVLGFSGSSDRMALFPVTSNPAGGRPPSSIISNGHICATAHSIQLYSAHRAVIFAIAQLSCFTYKQNILKRYIEKQNTASLSTRLNAKIVTITQNPLSSQDESTQMLRDEVSRSNLHSVEWHLTERRSFNQTLLLRGCRVAPCLFVHWSVTCPRFTRNQRRSQAVATIADRTAKIVGVT